MLCQCAGPGWGGGQRGSCHVHCCERRAQSAGYCCDQCRICCQMYHIRQRVALVLHVGQIKALHASLAPCLHCTKPPATVQSGISKARYVRLGSWKAISYKCFPTYSIPAPLLAWTVASLSPLISFLSLLPSFS